MDKLLWSLALSLVLCTGATAHPHDPAGPQPGLVQWPANVEFAPPKAPDLFANLPPNTGTALDRKRINRVLMVNYGDIKFCYQRGLEQNPKLRATLVLSFMVGLKGTVTEATVTGLDGISACVLKRVKAWLFPIPEGEPVHTRLSYVLKPD